MHFLLCIPLVRWYNAPEAVLTSRIALKLIQVAVRPFLIDAFLLIMKHPLPHNVCVGLSEITIHKQLIYVFFSISTPTHRKAILNEKQSIT